MIILASKSASRSAMLRAAEVQFDARPAHLDERKLEAQAGDAAPEDIAVMLAKAKALAVVVGAADVGAINVGVNNDGASNARSALVLGSDSLVVVEGRRFDKPDSREQAVEHLRYFSGKIMHLHSAAALARDGEIVWHHAAVARLTVRELSEAFIEHYLEAEWPEVSYCVGVFRIEAMGVQLFERIDGDQFTVLGMPLLPVLGALRDLGELPR